MLFIELLWSESRLLRILMFLSMWILNGFLISTRRRFVLFLVFMKCETRRILSEELSRKREGIIDKILNKKDYEKWTKTRVVICLYVRICFVRLILVAFQFLYRIYWAISYRFSKFWKYWKALDEIYNLVYLQFYYNDWLMCVFEDCNCTIQIRVLKFFALVSNANL